jgi:hypothetical protein
VPSNGASQVTHKHNIVRPKGHPIP